MLWQKRLIAPALLAAGMLLLAQCGSQNTQPTAPGASLAGAGTACTADCRSLEVLYPPVSGPFCKGQCTKITFRVMNPCGDYTTYAEGWYDGNWVDLGSVTNQNWLHWDSPEGMHAARNANNSVRLRLIVVDGLGLLGSQEFNLSPLLPAPPPPRVPQNFN